MNFGTYSSEDKFDAILHDFVFHSKAFISVGTANRENAVYVNVSSIGCIFYINL